MNDLGELETLQSFKEQQLENNKAEEAEAVDMRQRAEEELTAAKRRLDKLISERNHMFSKKERDNAKLEEMHYQERDLTDRINSTEDDLVGKKRMHEQIEAEIDLNGKNEQAINEAIKDKTCELDDLSRTINDLDAEIKTRRREKDELKARLSNLQISLKREQNNGSDADQTNHSYDVLIRQKNVQMGQKQNELETYKEEIEKSLNQNTHLTNDVDTVKKNIESLISINKDVLEEMRNFTETDEQIRYLLDRRNRVNDLRARTERDIAGTTSFRSSTYIP